MQSVLKNTQARNSNEKGGPCTIITIFTDKSKNRIFCDLSNKWRLGVCVVFSRLRSRLALVDVPTDLMRKRKKTEKPQKF